jgi:drug/metabolite transporter (DMT)-like permease
MLSICCSTLDPVLRKEVAGPDWKLFALLASVGTYMFLTPGGGSNQALEAF